MVEGARTTNNDEQNENIDFTKSLLDERTNKARGNEEAG